MTSQELFLFESPTVKLQPKQFQDQNGQLSSCIITSFKGYLRYKTILCHKVALDV